MWNFGYHAVYEHGFKEAIELAAKHRFHYVQFDLNVPRFYVDGLSRGDLKAIKAFASDSGVCISFHAPGDNIGLFTDYPAIRNGLLEHIKVVLEKANILDAHHLTVHPLSPPSFRRADTLKDGFQEEYKRYFSDVLAENLRYLAGNAGNVLLCVENCHLGAITRDALEGLFLEGARLFLTLDYAKMHKPGPTLDQDQHSFFMKHKERIRELHLHDTDTSMRSHLSPGQGNLDFGRLFSEFPDEGMWLTIEVRPFSEARKARDSFLEMMDEIR
jgi:sugar phosphate isomerase/epimerase